jgi:hypothetical protein
MNNLVGQVGKINPTGPANTKNLELRTTQLTYALFGLSLVISCFHILGSCLLFKDQIFPDFYSSSIAYKTIKTLVAF